jgi:hypothetical protein
MNSFEEICNQAVKRFIKTVAIIDDEATYDLRPSQNEMYKQNPLNPPVNGMMGKIAVESSTSGVDKTDASTQKDNDISSQLDAKAVVNAFADMGIVCCIQRPEIEDHPFKRAVNLAASVDVLVIDWVLNKKNRSLSRNIIKKILEEDKRAGHRMRLIIVYTSHYYISSMLEDIEKVIHKIYDNDPLMKNRILQSNGVWLLKSDWMRIVILNKEITYNSLTGARIVPFNKLPETIISEFSEMMKGIIPNATLHGIAAVREQTHTLLSILNNKLDGAYCFHRALIPEPSDSVDFAMNLVTNEIDTIIRTDSSARNVVDEKGIKAWFEQYSDQRTKIPCYGSSLSVETIEKFILNGHLCNCKKTVKSEFDKNRTQITDGAGKTLPQPPLNFMNFGEVLYSMQKDAINGCYELSNLQCTAMDIGGRLYDGKSQNPTLHMGTILKKQKGSSSEWFLCLTPLCDSVRLDEESNFLFLQLYPGEDDQADVVIKNQDGTFKSMKLKQNKIKIVTIPFSPKNGSKKIDAYLWRKEWRVKSTRTSYQWIGELRYSKALDIAHYVATNSSRVGIDEFEWLRQKATI